jgi:hypothetical protein
LDRQPAGGNAEGLGRHRCRSCLAFAFGAWLYWDAFLGPSSRTESLSGLVVLHGPLYQFVILAIALLAATLLNRPSASA